MATRIRRQHTEEIREKIKTSQLINRLTEHAFGNVEMTPSQVRAIEVLLKKTLPDLSSVEVAGDGEDGGISINIRAHAAS